MTKRKLNAFFPQQQQKNTDRFRFLFYRWTNVFNDKKSTSFSAGNDPYAIIKFLISPPILASVSMFHLFVRYFLPLLLSIRALHHRELASYRPIYITYFTILYFWSYILEPFLNWWYSFSEDKKLIFLLLQILLDFGILWLILPTSQGVRYVHYFLAHYVVPHGISWTLGSSTLQRWYSDSLLYHTLQMLAQQSLNYFVSSLCTMYALPFVQDDSKRNESKTVIVTPINMKDCHPPTSFMDRNEDECSNSENDPSSSIRL